MVDESRMEGDIRAVHTTLLASAHTLHTGMWDIGHSSHTASPHQRNTHLREKTLCAQENTV